MPKVIISPSPLFFLPVFSVSNGKVDLDALIKARNAEEQAAAEALMQEIHDEQDEEYIKNLFANRVSVVFL